MVAHVVLCEEREVEVAVGQGALRRHPDRRDLPGGRQLTAVVVLIAVCATIAGVFALRVRQEQDRLAHRHEVEAQVRDAQVVDALRSELDEAFRVGPPVPDEAPDPEIISTSLRPGLPVSLGELLPNDADFAIRPHGRIGDYDVYVVDTDRFAERAVDLYSQWLTSTELIPIDPFAAGRLPDAPRLTRGDVVVGVEANDEGVVKRVVVVGDDPIFSNAAEFETDE